MADARKTARAQGACRLPAEALRWTADPQELTRIEPEEGGASFGILGQARALSALKFGLGIRGPGFHIFVSGPSGIGKMTAVRAFLDRLSRDQPAPPDWCYVHDFEDPYRPRALKLPAGWGRKLAQDVEELLKRLRQDIPKAFESEDYQRKRERVIGALQRERVRLTEGLRQEAAKAGFAMEASPFGFMFGPVRDGKAMTEEALASLDEGEKESLHARKEELEAGMKASFQELRARQEEAHRELEELDRGVLLLVCDGLFQKIRDRYREQEGTARWLGEVRADLLRNADAFRRAEGAEVDAAELEPGGEREAWLSKYRVNVFIDNSRREGAPVVVEWDPWFGQLFGCIEKVARLGTLRTNLTMIRAGAVHRANGGYLVLPVEELLRSPLSWDTLKSVLRSGKIGVEEPEKRLGYFATKSLAPEPIPLDLKVILVGSARIHDLLEAYDGAFSEFFRVRVDFDTRIPRDAKAVREVLAFLSGLCRRQGLRAIEPEAAARLLEHMARLADSQNHLSAHFGALAELVREADHWASQAGAARIGRAHLRRALRTREQRADLPRSRLLELIREGSLVIETSGAAIGRVNGLAVLSWGEHAFGKPARITASVGPGREGIVDIEREVELAGPIHSKGILILNGYLVYRYAQSRPLNLTARLVFEQSYSGVEGDSASSAELCALLSAISGLPARQGIAVTGSVNQHGEMQAVGGANEKIEGFFDVCRLRGLTGEQGVVLPESNRSDLMLREDVVEAARAGRFHVWAVRTVDQAIEILTGVPAGKRGPDGAFPPGTVNGAVERRLKEYSRSLDGRPRPEHRPRAHALGKGVDERSAPFGRAPSP